MGGLDLLEEGIQGAKLSRSLNIFANPQKMWRRSIYSLCHEGARGEKGYMAKGRRLHAGRAVVPLVSGKFAELAQGEIGAEMDDFGGKI